MNRLYKHEDVVQMLVDVIEQIEENEGIEIVDRPMGWESVRDYAEEVVSDVPSAEKHEWIPCGERLPEEGEVVLVCMRIESHKAEWEEQRSIEFGRISSDRYDYYGTGWEWLNESGTDYWQADWDNSILAWMPLPKPWKGADDE